MLKKQTVWLLTMLSLVVVLSVYYVTSPEGGSGSVVMTEENKEVSQNKTETEKEAKAEAEQPAEEAAEEQVEVQTEEQADGTVISSVSSDELFAELRLELEDKRSKLKDKLNAIVASSDATAAEKSEAYDEMEALDEAAHKEAMLETLIKSQGYDDALVRAEGNNVKITVKAKDHDKASANKILMLVRDEMENMEDVIVTFEQ